VIPAQFPGLLGADADGEAQHDVGVQPRLPGRAEQRKGLVEGQRPAWPSHTASGRVNQSGHIPTNEVMRLGVPGRSREGGPGDLQVPGGQPAAERLETGSDIPGRELPERPSPDVLESLRSRKEHPGPVEPPVTRPASRAAVIPRT
jgi:hypothetical protein